MDDHTTPLKYCTKCKQGYPPTTEYFCKNKACSDGLHTQCKFCRQKKNRQYWHENATAINEARRETYATDETVRQRNQEYHRNWRTVNRDRELEKKRQYYRENREYNAAKCRAWRETNLEYKREYDRGYAERNADRIRPRKSSWDKANRSRINQRRREKYILDPTARRISAINRDARKRNLPDTFTEKDWLVALAYFVDKCAYCAEKASLTADHFIPMNAVDCPGTIKENIVPVCKSCNSSKQDAEAHQWLERRFGKERGQSIFEKILEYFEWVRQQ